jgi:osmotically-inducible protein OsmY
MKRVPIVFILLVAVVVVGIVGTGFYRGWFRFTSDTADKNSNVTFSVDTDKFQADRKTAVASAQELGHQIKLIDKPVASTRHETAADRGEQHVSDAWITAKVKSSLMFTRSVDAFDITVSTADGRVTLDGIVHTNAERDLAIDVARDVRGVKNVDSKGLKAG